MLADKPMSWPVLSRKTLGSGRVSSFIQDEISTPSGEVMVREWVTHPGAVAVVAWDEEADTIAVLSQYRHPVRMELAEIPAGLLDLAGEDYLAAAARELAEEVELQAKQWDVLVDLCTSPGGCAESLRIYLARGLSTTKRPEGFVLEGEEAHLTWRWVPRQEVVAAIWQGRCQSPTLVTGVLALETARLSGGLGQLRAAQADWPIRRA